MARLSAMVLHAYCTRGGHPARRCSERRHSPNWVRTKGRPSVPLLCVMPAGAHARCRRARRPQCSTRTGPRHRRLRRTAYYETAKGRTEHVSPRSRRSPLSAACVCCHLLRQRRLARARPRTTADQIYPGRLTRDAKIFLPSKFDPATRLKVDLHAALSVVSFREEWPTCGTSRRRRMGQRCGAPAPHSTNQSTRLRALQRPDAPCCSELTAPGKSEPLATRPARRWT